jgi:hypothetical protein
VGVAASVGFLRRTFSIFFAKPSVFFPFWCFVWGPVIKLRLRQQRELGDWAFLKAVSSPRRKALDDSPSGNSIRNIEQMQYIESLL